MTQKLKTHIAPGEHLHWVHSTFLYIYIAQSPVIPAHDCPIPHSELCGSLKSC